MFTYWLETLLAVGFLAALSAPVLSSDKGRRSLVLALRSLWLHKLRAFLSVLGIIIGVGAVIALMAFGEGSMQDALDDIARMGATNIIVRSVKPPDDGSTAKRSFVAIYGLTKSDYEKIATMCQGRVMSRPEYAKFVAEREAQGGSSPSYEEYEKSARELPSGTITRMVPMRVFPSEIRRLERLHNGRIVGTTPEYADVNKLELVAGRFLLDEDGLRMKNVAVVGAAVARSLFPYSNPLGESVRMGQYFYRIVGVLRDRMPTGGSGGSQAAEDFNQDVYIPLETMRARFGRAVFIRQSGSRMGEQVELSQVTITVSEIDKVRPTGDVIREILSQHSKADWAVTVPLDRLEEARRAKNRYKMLLALIAGISLLVGGIGIMNIMLATVTERTREIGIRRALGAKRRDITMQFLIEAVVQTSLGGLLGAVGGLSLVFLVPWAVSVISRVFAVEMHLPAQVHVLSIYYSLAVAVIVGVVFGLYPAWRASMLDPIEALRHE